jgi:succinyl-diaminopimelate desuccinylase
MSATCDLAIELISRRSVTPDDAGCQQLLAARLARVGFACEHLRFGEVDNLWARHGHAGPLLVFAGHTDVVPPGPLDAWRSDPFKPEIRDGFLYGRGAADMKGGIAAMITAVERFIAAHPGHAASIAFLITSDEEGPSINGTVKVVDWLQQQGEHIDWCLVGEPSSSERLGDIIKNGRRGSLSAILTVQGVQGHVAYPDRAKNPIHLALPALQALAAEVWDQGNEHFPPTSFQISNLNAGTGAENVIPGTLKVAFNVRYSTEWTADRIKVRVAEILNRCDLTYHCDWKSSGEPFLTPKGRLLDAVQASIFATNGVTAQAATTGGTSDGRFIAPTGAEVVELGPVNATIHKINECVAVADLDTLSTIYERMLERLLLS